MIQAIIQGFDQLFPKVKAYPIFNEGIVTEVFKVYQNYLNQGGKPYVQYDPRENTVFLADPTIKAIFNGMGGTSRFKTSNEKVMARDIIWSSLIIMRKSGLDLKAAGGVTPAPVYETPTTYEEPSPETPTYTDPTAPGLPATPVATKSNTMLYVGIGGAALALFMFLGGKKGKR